MSFTSSLCCPAALAVCFAGVWPGGQNVKWEMMVTQCSPTDREASQIRTDAAALFDRSLPNDMLKTLLMSANRNSAVELFFKWFIV